VETFVSRRHPLPALGRRREAPASRDASRACGNRYHHGKWAEARNAENRNGEIFIVERAWNVSVVAPTVAHGRANSHWHKIQHTLTGAHPHEEWTLGASSSFDTLAATSANATEPYTPIWDAIARESLGGGTVHDCRGEVGEELEEVRGRCDADPSWAPLHDYNSTIPCFAHAAGDPTVYFTVEEPWNFYLDLFIAVGCIFIVARALYALLHRRKGEEAPPEDWLASMRSMSAEFRETM